MESDAVISLAASSDTGIKPVKSGLLSGIKNIFRKNTLDAAEIQSPTSLGKVLSSGSQVTEEMEVESEEEAFKSEFFEEEHGPSADDLRNSQKVLNYTPAQELATDIDDSNQRVSQAEPVKKPGLISGLFNKFGSDKKKRETQVATNSMIYEKAMGLCDQGNSFYIYFSQTISAKEHETWTKEYIPLIEYASTVTWCNDQGFVGIATDKHTKHLLPKQLVNEIQVKGIPVSIRG